MKESCYKTFDELPLVLNAQTVAKVLGIAPSSAYELMHEKDFPTSGGTANITIEITESVSLDVYYDGVYTTTKEVKY